MIHYPHARGSNKPKWRLASIHIVHNELPEDFISNEELEANYSKEMDSFEELTKKIVNVRPIPLDDVDIMDFRSVGCKATKFYEVRRKDDPYSAGTCICACEVYILK